METKEKKKKGFKIAPSLTPPDPPTSAKKYEPCRLDSGVLT
jgi:hypothetical protein